MANIGDGGRRREQVFPNAPDFESLLASGETVRLSGRPLEELGPDHPRFDRFFFF